MALLCLDQTKTEHRLGITQPRMSDLLRDKLSTFNLDALVNMLARLGDEFELGRNGVRVKCQSK